MKRTILLSTTHKSVFTIWPQPCQINLLTDVQDSAFTYIMCEWNIMLKAKFYKNYDGLME